MITKSKHGVFFSIDALIALTIIFFVVLLAYPKIEESRRETKIQEDIIVTLSTLKAGEIQDTYMSSLIAQGLVTDMNKSVLEILGEFYVTNKTIARELASSVLTELDTPENIGLWYDSTLLASKNNSGYENAQTVETARQILSGIKEGNGVTGFAARAQLSSSLQTKYSYFGGYVGDGNLSLLMEYNGTIQSANIEFASNSNVDIYINNNFAGSYPKSPSTTIPINYTIPITHFQSGLNTLELKGQSLYIAGGFIKIRYQSEVQYERPTRYNFPGINGTINLYDSIYVPGQVSSMNAFLHYKSPYTLFLKLGNTTIFSGSSSNETTLSISNAQLSSQISYLSLSQTTTPLRLGLENITLNGSGTSDIDVVLITDVSGSMDWRLDNDNTGIARNCNDPLLYDPSTKRISLAKCLDKDFVATILNSSLTSRIALVSFSSDSDSYTSFTRDQALLNNTINNYGANGATCVSCALNRAYLLLQSESNSSRKKFIVAMTDGVSNRRSTPICTDLFAESEYTTTLSAGGQSGTLLQNPNNAWNSVASPTSSQINSMDFLSQSAGFAVGNSGTILSWNGVSWVTSSSPVATNINAVDIYNTTFALAVGSSGRVLKWNGASWTLLSTISSQATLYDVLIINNTAIFAVGVRSGTGRIYRSVNGGSSWSEQYASGSSFKGISNLSASLAFAVGDGGEIARWNGASWSSQSSPTTHDLYSIEGNQTFAIAVGGENGNVRAIRYNGASWSSSLSAAGDSLRAVKKSSSLTYAVGDGGTLYSYTTSWQKEFTLPAAYQGNSTTGISCTADDDSCSEVNSYPSLNANYSSCRARTDLDATIFSIGFGPVATCSFAAQTLQAIASCGNGTYYSSSNATLLQQFYQNIAQTIIQISYAQQTAQLIGNTSTTLYPDSYIEFNYTKTPLPYGLIIATEKLFTNTTSGSFTIPINTTLVEARVVSYSGPRWTSLVIMNNNTIFNLANYGNDYTKLGDPYFIYLPPSLVLPENNLSLLTGVAPNNLSEGSLSNKILITLVKNASGYSPITAQAEGCIWNVDFDDGTNVTLVIPTNYSGSEECFYQAGTQQYNLNDAVQAAVFRLLQNLDLNANSMVDVPLVQEDIAIDITEMIGIPFTWSTEIQVRTWR